MTHVEIFILLQLLDFMTTLAGIRMGGTELSPFIAWLMRMADPVTGLAAAKLIGLGLGAFCFWKNRIRVILWVNYIFAGLVVWNVFNILKAVL